MSLKVTVVQLATPNIDSYGMYSLASVNEYCNLHGYDHVVQRSTSVPDLHINWSKIDLLRHALTLDNDYVVLFDADVVIADQKKSIEYFLDHYANETTEIMMPRDTYLAFGSRRKRRPPRSMRPNAGFIILRNSNTGRQMIQDWLDAARGEGKKYNDIHPRNQLVYWNFVMPRYISELQILPDYVSSNTKHDYLRLLRPIPFMYHVMMSEDSKRIKKMAKVYQAYNNPAYLEKVRPVLQVNDGIIKIKELV